LVLACLTGALAAAPFAAHAQAYPNRPIRFIVPWPAGGIADVRARIMAEHLSRGLGQPVIVENRPGASGSVGAAMAAKAKPDGYTVMYGSVQEQVLARCCRPKSPSSRPRLHAHHAVHATRSCLVRAHGGALRAELVALAKSSPGA
jgi:tripartite-type tricarboxylate transporter receptor subunit TctC